MTSMTYEVEDAEFGGDRCNLIGVGVYEYDFCYDYDDGDTAENVTLLRLELDGVHLTREQVQLIAGKAALERAEDFVSDELHTLYRAGEMAA